MQRGGLPAENQRSSLARQVQRQAHHHQLGALGHVEKVGVPLQLLANIANSGRFPPLSTTGRFGSDLFVIFGGFRNQTFASWLDRPFGSMWESAARQ